MTLLAQYSCPVCGFNQTASKFCEKPIMEPLDLGYMIFRECKGRKGFPIVEKKSLVEFSGTNLGKAVIKQLKHHVLAVFHALYKQKLVTESDLRFYEDFENLFYNSENTAHNAKVYEELNYSNENLKQNLHKLKQKLQGYENLNYENDNLRNKLNSTLRKLQEFESLSYEYENLKNSYEELSAENQQIKESVDNSVYAGGY